MIDMEDVLTLAAGFLALIKGADLLVKGASAIARRLKISELAIGLTVVAFGTSCPELFVNIVASLKGESGIVLGNIIGSNIANVYLILGLSAVIYPLQVTRGTVWKEIPFVFMTAVLFALLVNDWGFSPSRAASLSTTDGVVLLVFFCFFLLYSFRISSRIEGLEDLVPGGAGVYQGINLVDRRGDCRPSRRRTFHRQRRDSSCRESGSFENIHWINADGFGNIAPGIGHIHGRSLS